MLFARALPRDWFPHLEIETMKLSARPWFKKGVFLASKGIGFGLLLSAFSVPAQAHIVPEMDPSLATGAMALLAGGLLLIAGRRRRSK